MTPNALLVYGLILSGSYVVGNNATLACPSWPLCGAAPYWAIEYHLADINIFHRLVSIFVGLVLIWTLVSAWRRRAVAPGQAWVALAAGILFVTQTAIGGLVVLLGSPDFIAGLHLALAIALWCSLILLTVLVGWAAVTNSISLPAIWLFAIIFYWTPPHFWALSLLIQKDYEKAQVPMMPVVMGEHETRKQIFLYSLLLLAVTMILFAMRAMGVFYLVCALLLDSILVYMSVRLLRDQTKKWARTLFWYSNCYLALIFAVMVLDRVIH